MRGSARTLGVWRIFRLIRRITASRPGHVASLRRTGFVSATFVVQLSRPGSMDSNAGWRRFSVTRRAVKSTIVPALDCAWVAIEFDEALLQEVARVSDLGHEIELPRGRASNLMVPRAGRVLLERMVERSLRSLLASQSMIKPILGTIVRTCFRTRKPADWKRWHAAGSIVSCCFPKRSNFCAQHWQAI
jgi:hypothetical protein